MRRRLGQPLEQRVAEVLRTAKLDGPAGPLVVAVSGGPDSTALLRALVSLRQDLNLPLHIVHVDHGLRPDSVADATYTRRLAQRWSTPFTIRTTDVRRLRSARGLSLEDAARQARYAILAEVARETHAVAVLTGHTTDDQVETILLALLRGAGLRGLAGMETVDRLPPTPDGPVVVPIPLVRPLLGTSRAEVEAYLKVHHLRPRRDPSNRSPEFLRNRVRARLVPLLDELRPGARLAVLRAARAAREALDFLETAATEAWPAVARQEGEAWFLRLDTLARLHSALRTLTLQRAVEEATGSGEGFTARHWEAMATLLAASPGSALRLPHGLRLTVLYGEAVLTRGDPPCPLPRVEAAMLDLPGKTAAGGWTFQATITPGSRYRLEAAPNEGGTGPLPGPSAVELRCSAGLSLAVRPREPGDRIQLSRGSRKLQDVLTDARIPRGWRDRVPVVINADTGVVLWAVGVAAAAGVQAISPRRPRGSRIGA